MRQKKGKSIWRSPLPPRPINRLASEGLPGKYSRHDDVSFGTIAEWVEENIRAMSSIKQRHLLRVANKDCDDPKLREFELSLANSAYDSKMKSIIGDITKAYKSILEYYPKYIHKLSEHICSKVIDTIKNGGHSPYVNDLLRGIVIVLSRRGDKHEELIQSFERISSYNSALLKGSKLANGLKLTPRLPKRSTARLARWRRRSI